MKYKIPYLFLMSIVLTGLSGCGKVVDWMKDSFDQGSTLEDTTGNPRTYVRSVTVYDQFTTAAMFDALWLSDDVRTAYVNLHALKRGTSEELQKVFLRRQLEENKHFIAFYVLSLYEFPLGDPESLWTLFLRVSDKNYYPLEVKAIDLVPEYRAILGKSFTRFKQVYMVKFDAKDIEDKQIITPDVQQIALYFRSLHKEAILAWRFNNQPVLAQHKEQTPEHADELDAKKNVETPEQHGAA